MRKIIVTLAVALAFTIAVSTAAARTAKTQVLKRKFQISTYKLAWYEGRGHWMLRPRFDRCAEIRWPKPRGQCFKHRENLRWHKQRVDRIHHALWPPQKTTSGPSWLVGAFLCIHSYEGPWDANTGNGYEGGLQFGHSEWQTYGGRYAAHAYDASPAQQIAAGIAYHAVSGFSPWPNTARACGLL